jgi:hypothetical protein
LLHAQVASWCFGQQRLLRLGVARVLAGGQAHIIVNCHFAVIAVICDVLGGCSSVMSSVLGVDVVLQEKATNMSAECV